MAIANSDAVGKMDMLSVLLHEYDHALGMDHNLDSHDFMGTTLTPGMRRLPTSDELTLMAQLVAEAKQNQASTALSIPVGNPTPVSSGLPLGAGFGVTFLGLLRRNTGSRNSLMDDAIVNTGTDGGICSPLPLGEGNRPQTIVANTPTQYAIAANPALIHGNFSNDTATGWATTGQVEVTNGFAVLSEVANNQTRLNQVFVIGAEDSGLAANTGLLTKIVTNNLSLDLAARRRGYGTDYTRVNIYVDDQKIGTWSIGTALNWQNLALQFAGNGQRQTIKIVSEGAKDG